MIRASTAGFLVGITLAQWGSWVQATELHITAPTVLSREEVRQTAKTLVTEWEQVRNTPNFWREANFTLGLEAQQLVVDLMQRVQISAAVFSQLNETELNTYLKDNGFESRLVLRLLRAAQRWYLRGPSENEFRQVMEIFQQELKPTPDKSAVASLLRSIDKEQQPHDVLTHPKPVRKTGLELVSLLTSSGIEDRQVFAAAIKDLMLIARKFYRQPNKRKLTTDMHEVLQAWIDYALERAPELGPKEPVADPAQEAKPPGVPMKLEETKEFDARNIRTLLASGPVSERSSDPAVPELIATLFDAKDRLDNYGISRRTRDGRYFEKTVRRLLAGLLALELYTPTDANITTHGNGKATLVLGSHELVRSFLQQKTVEGVRRFMGPGKSGKRGRGH